MSGTPSGAVGHALGIGLVWSALWLALALSAWVVLGALHPDSIDPGDGPLAVAAVFGPMGFLSGAASALLLHIADRAWTPGALALPRAAGWGLLGSAIVQLAYLGQGDQGVVANLAEALLLSVVGGVVAVAWLGLARGWERWRRPAITAARQSGA